MSRPVFNTLLNRAFEFHLNALANLEEGNRGDYVTADNMTCELCSAYPSVMVFDGTAAGLLKRQAAKHDDWEWSRKYFNRPERSQLDPVMFKERWVIHESLKSSQLYVASGVVEAELLIGAINGTWKANAKGVRAPFTQAQFNRLKDTARAKHTVGTVNKKKRGDDVLKAVHHLLVDEDGPVLSDAFDGDCRDCMQALMSQMPAVMGIHGAGVIVAATLLALGAPASTIVPWQWMAMVPAARWAQHLAVAGLAGIPEDYKLRFEFQAKDGKTFFTCAHFFLACSENLFFLRAAKPFLLY